MQSAAKNHSSGPARRAPVILETEGWADYALLDSGNGEKLERYGQYRIVRPEAQALWWQYAKQDLHLFGHPGQEIEADPFMLQGKTAGPAA